MTITENSTRTANDVHTHTPRMDLFALAPDVYKAMVALDRAARQGVDPQLAELIKIRASQLNHCAFCLEMHTRDARTLGISDEKIVMLAAWEEAAGYFTEKERAVLALTESVTVLTDGFVPDEVWEQAAEHVEEQELAQIIAQIFVINSWNRIAVTTRKAPTGPR